MSESAIEKTVLIVDDDLGFVFWLGCVLSEAGYQAWPARNGQDAAALLEELGVTPDLLIMNSKVCATPFVEAQRRNPDLKIILLTEEPCRWPESVPGIDLAVAKPASHDEVSELEWVGVIDSMLASRPQ